MSDDLVERVARAMAVAEGFDPDLIINNDTPDCPQPLWGLYRRSARAAIAVVLEEAAKVVALMPRTHTKIKEDHDVLGMNGTWTFTLNNGPAECAAVIRALVKT